MDKLHWAVNSLVVRDGTYFGFGWVFHEKIEIRDVSLKVGFSDGASCAVAASFGKPRDDVADSFPALPLARHSGFILLGSCDRKPKSLSELFIQVTLVDDSLAEFRIPQVRIKCLGGDDISFSVNSIRQLTANVQSSLYLIKSFQLANLLAKTRRYFTSRPAPSLAKGEAVLSILDANKLRNLVLLIDHDLGGGANYYRERLVTEKINAGATVLILSCDLATLSFLLMVRNNQGNKRFTISGINFMLELGEQLEIKEIIYNTGVTFTRPEDLPSLIVKLKRKYSSRLTLLVHDFFMACPSHFLIDDAGRYCGIPEIERCQSCLANNRQDFSSLYRFRDIVQWRASWDAVISIADEIKTFSESSLKVLQRAYPALNSSRVYVTPHVVTYFKHVKVKPSYTATLKLGVVGQIGYHKGARIVQYLAREIKARGLEVQIVVIGTIEAQCEPSVVSETGSYQHDNLPALLESVGVNIMLFPSIWPETFSYVVQELIELDLPVACFDLGAPAERLRLYKKGMILRNMTVSATLDDLISFHRRIYQGRSL